MPSTQHGAATTIDVDGIEVRLSSPDKPVFSGISKRQVMEYYLSVGARMVAQVGDRPTALERWPDGVAEDGERFYQKHLPKTVPSYVSGIKVRFPSGRPGVLLNPDSRAAIAWAVQMSAITFHAWPVTAPQVERPDQLRLDLDPPDNLGFADAIRVAHACREVVSEFDWPAFVKTSGGRGLHVFVPIRPEHSFVDVRHAAIAIGREVERRLPDLVTMSWWKEERGGRIFIDFNQNAQDRVMASAYSLRARPKATASMPLAWHDLDDVTPQDFTLRTVPHLVATLPDPWTGMTVAAVDLAPALDAWDRDVAAGLPELPYPPDFPKMPGEPPRVQPSRKRKDAEDKPVSAPPSTRATE
jgi:bifunctional non-homologous end joining protein LigD